MCTSRMMIAAMGAIGLAAGCGPERVSFGEAFYADASSKRVAVLPFDEPSGEAAGAADGEAMAALMTDALVAVPSYQITERSRLRKALAEHKSAPSKFVEERGLEETGELLNADLLVLGSVNHVREAGGVWPVAELSLSVRCVDVKSGGIVWAVSPDVSRFGSVRGATKSICRDIANAIESEYRKQGETPVRRASEVKERPKSDEGDDGAKKAVIAPVWPRRHRVVEGDTLSGLSMQHYRSSRYVEHILQANRQIKYPDRLKIGETIVIPAPPEESPIRAAQGPSEP